MTPCQIGPSGTQYAFGIVTLLIGVGGSWLALLAGNLTARAAGVHAEYRFGAPTGEADLAQARAAAERRRLLERAGVLSWASTAALFFALVSGLTINFPAFWVVGCIAAASALACGAVTWFRLPKIERRIAAFLRIQETIVRMRGFLFSVESTTTLNLAISASDAEMQCLMERLDQMQQEYDRDVAAARVRQHPAAPDERGDQGGKNPGAGEA